MKDSRSSFLYYDKQNEKWPKPWHSSTCTSNQCQTQQWHCSENMHGCLRTVHAFCKTLQSCSVNSLNLLITKLTSGLQLFSPNFINLTFSVVILTVHFRTSQENALRKNIAFWNQFSSKGCLLIEVRSWDSTCSVVTLL